MTSIMLAAVFYPHPSGDCHPAAATPATWYCHLVTCGGLV